MDCFWAGRSLEQANLSRANLTGTDPQDHDRGRRGGRSMRTRPAMHTYLLRGRVWCATCGRRCQTLTVKGRPLYRCRLTPSDDARRIDLPPEHRRVASVAESRVLRAVDTWIAGLFSSEQRERTIAVLLAAQGANDPGVIAHAGKARARRRRCRAAVGAPARRRRRWSRRDRRGRVDRNGLQGPSARSDGTRRGPSRARSRPGRDRGSGGRGR